MHRRKSASPVHNVLAATGRTKRNERVLEIERVCTASPSGEFAMEERVCGLASMQTAVLVCSLSHDDESEATNCNHRT